MIMNVVDAPTGAGKTTALINYVREQFNSFRPNTKDRFIIATPYLSEVERLTKDLNNTVYVENPEGTSKKQDIIRLIAEGKNIVTTHSLFNLTTCSLNAITRGTHFDYSLFVDEELPVFKGIQRVNNLYLLKKNDVENTGLLKLLSMLSQKDIENAIRDKVITIDKATGQIIWNTDTSYRGLWEVLRLACTDNDVYYYKLKTEQADKQSQNALIFLTNIDVWGAFKNVFILTYRFDTLDFSMYCRLHNIPVNYYHIEDSTFKKGYKKEYPKGLKELVFDETFSLPGTALSKNWYRKQADGNTKDLRKLKAKLRTFIRKAKGKYIWSTFKDFKGTLSGRDVSPTQRTQDTKENQKTFFVPCNQKATNEYKDRTYVAYTCNSYMHPVMAQFLKRQGVTFDEEQWALSGLIQFVWRSNLREVNNKKPVHVFIPSERMRTLFKNWVDEGIANGAL